MKVYSWKTLLVTILIGGLAIISEIKDMMRSEVFAIFPLIFWGYLVFKGLWVSLTREGFEEDLRNEAIGNSALRKLFGQWAFIAKYGGLILIILAGLSINLIPSQRWLSLLLFIGGLVYYIVVGILLRKYVKMEKRKYL